MFNDTQELQSWEANQATVTYPDRITDQWMNKHPGACPQCGSRDGMESWYPDEVEALLAAGENLEDWAWHKRPGNKQALYTPCYDCDTDTSGFERISLVSVMEWLHGSDCDCVLPSQSCPACRAAARETYGNGIPF